MNTPDKSVDEDIRTKRGEEKEVQQHRNSSMNSQINIQSKKKVKTNILDTVLMLQPQFIGLPADQVS